MKKIAKHLLFIACMLLVVTPVLSACGQKKMYRVNLYRSEGGTAEMKIGKAVLVDRSYYEQGSKITITVKPSETHTIKEVKANGIVLTAREGVAIATYTHILKAELALYVTFEAKNQSTPDDQKPPVETCGDCGVCAECLAKINLAAAKETANDALDFIYNNAFAGKPGSSTALATIGQAITSVNNATSTGGVNSAFSNAMSNLFSGAIIVGDCSCPSLHTTNCACLQPECVVCDLTATRGDAAWPLIRMLVDYKDNTEKLLTMIQAIRDIGKADTQAEAASIYLEMILKTKGSSVLGDFGVGIFTYFDTISGGGYFNNLTRDSAAIRDEALVPAAVDAAEYTLHWCAVLNTSSSMSVYIKLNDEEMEVVEAAFWTALADHTIAGGFIKTGKEDAFRAQLLNGFTE